MFYVFHGNDSHAQKETLAALGERLGDQQMLDLNTTRFEGSSVTFSELRHACDSVPFLAEKRLVVVSDLMARKPAFLDELLEYLPALPEPTRLVFLESKSLPASHPLIRLAEQDKRGHVRRFELPEGSGLERWIRGRVRASGGQITTKAAHMLAFNVGSNMELLDNEIEKLVTYKGAERIDAEDVEQLCPYVAEASIFDMVDALGSRDGPVAARMMHTKLSEGADPAFLFAMIVRQFRLLIQAKELAESGSTPAQIARALDVHNFVAGKLRHQAKNFTPEQLKRIYAHLLETDVAVKSGRIEMATALNLLVAGVAA